MQGNQRVEKFKKVPRVTVEGTGEEATITRGKKYNKPKRYSTFKKQFFQDGSTNTLKPKSDLWG